MSFLKKLGLIEEEVVETPVEYIEDDVAPTPEVDADIDSTENIIADIYQQNEMSDTSNSIYTVRAYMDQLPSEMTTAKKQQTVAGILAVSQKSVADLLVDAKNREDVLRAARDKIIGERTAEVATANADIEALKQAIEAATIKIKSAEDIIAATNKSIDAELKVIDDLIEFCNGMEEK